MSTESNQAFDQPEDEDLFDFPVAPAYSSGGMPTGAPQREEAPSASTEAAPKSAEAAPAKPVPAMNEGDFDLDEDLFDFGTLFDATQPLSTAEDAAALAALDDQESEAIPAPAPAQPTTPQPAAAPKASSQPTPSPKVTQTNMPRPTANAGAAAGSTTSELVAAGLAAPASMDWSPEPKRGRLIEILAVCFLLLNSALILLAWRAGSDFRETLAAVTRTVTDSVAEGHARGQLQNPPVERPPSQASLPVEPDVTNTKVDEQDLPTPSTAPKRPEQAPSDLLDMPQAALELAMERIAAGRYDEARRGLFRLLANRDRTALSDAMVVQAEMLIARAFAAQAEEVDR